jgi:hypothetical protein
MANSRRHRDWLPRFAVWRWAWWAWIVAATILIGCCVLQGNQFTDATSSLKGFISSHESDTPILKLHVSVFFPVTSLTSNSKESAS